MEPFSSGLQTLFMGLINYTIEVSIMIGLIFIIRFVSRRKLPPWWYYSLWMILLIRMLIPLKFEKISNLFNVMPPVLTESSLFELSAIKINASSNVQGWNLQVDHVLLFLWFAGVVILGIYILLKNLNFWAIIKSRPFLTDQRLLCLLEDCKRRMKIHTVPGVVITNKVKSPALYGYIRPRLLLPEGVLEKLNDLELTYVFMHELGHLKRHDIGVSWLLSIMQIIHWFNPLVWLAFYQMRVDQESACDASVLSRIRHNQSADYGNAIIGFLEKFCQNRQLSALAGIMESKSQMKRRIAMVTNYKRYSRKMTVFTVALLISIGLISFTLSGFAEVKQLQTEKIINTGKAYKLSQEQTEKDVDAMRVYGASEAETKKDVDTGKAYKLSHVQTEKDVDNTRVYGASEVQTEKDVDTTRVYRASEVDTLPALLKVDDAYPFVVRRENIEGRVVARFVVTKEGTTRDASIFESFPVGVFDESALLAIEHSTFNPATKGGEAVDVKVILPIEYHIE